MSQHRPRIENDIWRKMKILAAYEGVSTEDIINKVLENYDNKKEVVKNGKYRSGSR